MKIISPLYRLKRAINIASQAIYAFTHFGFTRQQINATILGWI